MPSSSSKSTPPKRIDTLYGEWFIDYASYVILERAVPSIHDGLKPVQRRILHSLHELEDGRYNKVANVVGNTMKYHPHGEASIADAMIQLGQKDLLIDTQGNWGNLLTGDKAAAPRYIEARLSPFALEILFNAKTTEWVPSYDGRNREPTTLPAKFPLLLAQGAEGIAVGLACKILPHNVNELIDGSIAALRKEPVEIFPDFPTGGIADFSEYQEGLRGGKVRVRARMETYRTKTIKITEIPAGTTTTSLIDSILSAHEKGKIKIQKVEDNTAEHVEILLYLPSGTDPEKVIPALYAFTDCEVSLSPNACVIEENKPQFLSVNTLLKRSAQFTKELLKRELEIKLHELNEKWHFASLEKLFIEKRIYHAIEECETWEAVLKAIDKGLRPYKKKLKRPITEEDRIRLTEIKIKRISKYDSHRADEQISALETAIGETEKNLGQLTRYTIRYFKELKKKYGKGHQRKTERTTFTKVVASQVAVAHDTLYLNRKEGFAGYALKREEPIEKCSRMDDLIVFGRDGTMKVTKIKDKVFIGKNPAHLAVFQKENAFIYSMIYRDGTKGRVYAKRFMVQGVTRDRLYDLTKGTKGTRVLYFARHQTEESSAAQKLEIHLKPALRLRNVLIPFDFGSLDIKGRSAIGNIVTKHSVQKIVPAKKNPRDAK